MRRWWGVAVGAAVALVLPFAATSGAAPGGPDALRADLDRILADPRLDGAHAGVVVRDPETDQVLYSRQAGYRVTPASNAKLFTAAAALEALGPDYRFRTDVVSDARRSGPVLDGDLFLRGTGDPTVLAADYDRLAAQVADSGIREVRGTLRTDATWFDDVPLGAGWAWDDEPYYYAAPVSALTAAPDTDFDAGSAKVRVTPTTPGKPADLALEPSTGVVQLENRTTTAAQGARPNVTVERGHGSSRVVVSGTVPAGGAPSEDFTSVPDPAAYAADLFTRALAAHGVSVRPGAPGAAPAGARALAARESMPLRDLLVPFLKLSNNEHAEVLVKSMGRVLRGQGTWDAGLAVLSEKLRGLGVDPRVLRMVDGSGLSALDAVTPEQLTLLLDNARQRPWFREFQDALPVAGEQDRMVGGTLRNRMGGTPAAGNVHAKTGSMTGVTSLSGYVTGADRRPLVFSVVFNDFVADPPNDLQDAIAVRLAQYDGANDQARGVPAVPHPRTSAERGLECSWVKGC
ncbi:D-alanyl-D-alanine carboxypeptidase/D-alanyl-D-alanine endopeptidase [Saccharopolyspora rosea]|uniref:D-alanyl-D-alanine carboxypeptidase/D-alanyl-D-alanine-endopeptidase n=1 Tax=Saccharopolyspora rosea TaxID=524884 RepID=A0ABW3G361_9PSEU|nr:D-alanyl-D-alanine carboxypeptidase/D-alanyl-D-alanine-endopeptidase [Saccharopolyspora rosea]